VSQLNGDVLMGLFHALDVRGTRPGSEGKCSLAVAVRVCRAWKVSQVTTSDIGPVI
jgi:hypothetical protein